MMVYRVASPVSPLVGVAYKGDEGQMSAPFYLGEYPDNQFVAGAHYCAFGVGIRACTTGNLICGDGFHTVNAFFDALKAGVIALYAGEFDDTAIIVNAPRDGQVFLVAGQVAAMRPIDYDTAVDIFIGA